MPSTVQCMVIDRWRSWWSWRTGLLRVEQLLGTSLWQDQPHLRRQRDGLDQPWRCINESLPAYHLKIKPAKNHALPYTRLYCISLEYYNMQPYTHTRTQTERYPAFCAAYIPRPLQNNCTVPTKHDRSFDRHFVLVKASARLQLQIS